ncbi:MAG TPA: AAA domain-containing protein, partial [Planctomycetota bacterium]|nr:AAA domain-containing protein [Planctomycetota bacterium]
SALEELGYSDSVALREEIGRLRDAIAELARRAKAIGERMKVKIPVTANEARKLAERLELLVRTPRPDPQSLTASVWAVGLDEVKRLIERGRDYRENESAIAARWSSAFLDLEHDREAAEVRRHKGLGRFFQPGWWKLRGRLKSALREGASLPPRAQILADLDRAKRAREMRDELSAARERAALLFGSRWRGVESDPDELAAFAEWMKRFATHLEASDARLVELAARGLEDPQGAASDASELRSRIDDLSHAFESFRARAKLDDAGAFGTSLESASFETVLARLGDMRDHIEALHDWGHLVHAERECEEIGLASFLARAREVECADDELAPAFERLFLRLWLDAIFEARPALKRFRRQDHEQAIRDFRELDLAQLRLARRRLRKRLLDSLPDATWEASARSELGILQREIRRKRGHKPIRKLFQEIPNALLRLKPCLLMSPLSVAQFLDPRAIQFDVVIFDEASQISPEDAIGAIARGSQVVIVGDSRQLPPTAFFQRQESADVSLDSDDEDETPDLESILDECVVQGFPRQMLRWHYRSRHESLITFSNHHFYEKRLHTFPSSAEARPDLGVDFVHVADGIFDRAGTRANEVEADRVAQAVLEHFRRNPDRSLGVGAFSQAQQTAILDRLEALRREDESLEELFSPDREEPFFVKNLENIQGDERDVIFLSVGYGRDSHGKLYLNFGPLNKPGGERRLNVLVTRARRKLTVFSSIRSSDIDESRVSGIGPKLLKRYLEYAELGGRSAAAESATREALDGSLDRDYQGLEEAIAELLRASGHDVVAGVGHSRHRLGLAVRDAGKGSYILGIDTDGPAWQEQGTARDRERLRQQVLEGLGWRVHQVWSTEWLRNARGELDRILAAIERAKEGALEPEVLPLLDAAQKKASSRKKAPRRARPAEDLVRPYTVAMLDPAGEPDEFGESARAIAARLVATVRAEAPIHKSEATRRVAACWKIPKITRSVEETITAAIDKAAAEERIRIDAEDFLWLPGEADDLVPRSREAENAPRDADLIALEELATAAAIVLDRELRVPREDLVARTGRILGFSR